jgi:hypothetical protein
LLIMNHNRPLLSDLTNLISLQFTKAGLISLTDNISLQHPHIHHLPPEVLQEIFIHCIPPPAVPIHPNVAEAPLLLCRICSSWRNVAINMPELWQSLSIAPRFQRSPSNPAALAPNVVYKHYTSLVNGWFNRAKDQPLLSLRFWIYTHADSDGIQLTNSNSLVSEVLMANAHRFRYLDVGDFREMDLQTILNSTLTPMFPHLESLVLRFHDPRNLNPGMVTTFRSAPNLRIVVLPTLTVDWP